MCVAQPDTVQLVNSICTKHLLRWKRPRRNTQSHKNYYILKHLQSGNIYIEIQYVKFVQLKHT